MVRGMPMINHVEQLYDTCVITKQRRRPFLRQALYRAQSNSSLSMVIYADS